VAIRTLPALLPAGSDDLEHAPLYSVAVDRVIVAFSGATLPLQSLPLQLRQLPAAR
jgi:hypothetical protein